MEVEGRAFTSARLRSIARDQQQEPENTGGRAQLKCGNFHKTGHSRAECVSFHIPEVTQADRAGEVPGGTPKIGGGKAVRDTGPPPTRSYQKHIPQEDWVIKLKMKGRCAELVASLLHQGADCPVCKLVHWY